VLAPAATINRTGSLVLAGLCLGIASLIKTVVAVHWLALAVCVVITPFICTDRPRTQTLPATLTRLVALGIGPTIVWAATFGYFALTNRWTDFINAVFTFNLGYSGDQSLLARFAGFFTPDRHPFIFDSAMPLWIAGAIATVVLVVQCARHKDWQLLSILLLLIASFVAVCLPGRSWPHYYYLMIPPLVIGTAYAIALLTTPVSTSTSVSYADASTKDRTPLNPPLARGDAQARRFVRTFAVVAFAGVILSTFYTQYRDYLSQPPFGITVKRYNSRDFWGKGQGENVQSVTDPNDTIFVFGNEASIYYYAKRRCASRYTMITGLGDGMPGAERRRKILLEELRMNKPRLILVLFDQQPFDEWKQFLSEYYTEPVGWDLHDKTRQPIMFVLARKDAPIERIDWDWDRSTVGGWMLGETAR